jgi:hypothetical protein
MDTPKGRFSNEKADSSDGEPSDRQEPAALEAVRSIDAKKTLRQMDYRVIPIVTVLYLLSFLDRGYVKLSNLEAFLGSIALTQMAGISATQRCKAWKKTWSSPATNTTLVSAVMMRISPPHSDY